MEPDTDHLVVVTSMHGEKYLGCLDRAALDPKKYIIECAEKNLPVVLTDAYSFVCQAQPEVSRETGKVLGIKTFAAMLPIDLLSGPINVLYVRPSVWYFVKDAPSMKPKVEQLLEAARNNEAINQARDAGLHVPGRS